MKLADLALAVAVMFVWGINFVIAKLGVEEIPPMLLLSVRFALVAAILVPFVAVPRAAMRQVVLLSFVLGTIHFGMMFVGIRGVDASAAAVIAQLHVPFAAILAALFLGDRMRWRRILGLVLAFAGVVMIAGEPRTFSSLGSVALIVGAAFFWGVSTVQVKAMGDIDPLAITAWSGLLAAPQLLALSLLLETGHAAALANAGWAGWGAAVFMAVLVSAFGYGVWYRLLGRYPVSVVAPFSLMVPVFGVLSGVWLLGERLTPWMMIGTVMTVAGVAVIVVRRPKVAAEPTGP